MNRAQRTFLLAILGIFMMVFYFVIVPTYFPLSNFANIFPFIVIVFVLLFMGIIVATRPLMEDEMQQ